MAKQVLIVTAQPKPIASTTKAERRAWTRAIAEQILTTR
jgi:hypothetical protein